MNKKTCHKNQKLFKMVFLTVHYLVSTSFQSWRLKSIHQKVARILDSKNTVVFLKQSDGSKQGERKREHEK